MLNLGVKINHEDKDGNTALIYACAKPNSELVKKILEYKPNLNINNKIRKTAFIVACESSMEKTIELLLIQPNLNISFKYNYGTVLKRDDKTGL